MRLQDRTALKTFTVDKERLISKLKENKEKHSEEYNESMIGFKETLLSKMEDRINELQRLKSQFEATEPEKLPRKLPISVSRPENHTSDYEEIIEVMDWEQRESIELSLTDFNAYIQDRWSWSDLHLRTLETYSKSF